MKIVNLHGLNGTGNNSRDPILYQHFKDVEDVEVISPTYTVYDYNIGMKELLAMQHLWADDEVLFIGASTGAIYANQLAHRFDGKCVLVNPLVDPKLLLLAIGEQTIHSTGEKYNLTKKHVDSFPTEYKDIGMTLLVAGDDELIDASSAYKDPVLKTKKIILAKKGGHRFTEFSKYLNEIEEVMYTFHL